MYRMCFVASVHQCCVGWVCYVFHCVDYSFRICIVFDIFLFYRLWVASVMLIFCAEIAWILCGIRFWSTVLPSPFCCFRQAWGPSLLLCWSQASLRRQSLKKSFWRTRWRHSEESSPYPCITAGLNFSHAIELDTFYYVQCACRPTSIPSRDIQSQQSFRSSFGC